MKITIQQILLLVLGIACVALISLAQYKTAYGAVTQFERDPPGSVVEFFEPATYAEIDFTVSYNGDGECGPYVVLWIEGAGSALHEGTGTSNFPILDYPFGSGSYEIFPRYYETDPEGVYSSYCNSGPSLDAFTVEEGESEPPATTTPTTTPSTITKQEWLFVNGVIIFLLAFPFWSLVFRPVRKLYE